MRIQWGKNVHTESKECISHTTDAQDQYYQFIVDSRKVPTES